MELTAMFMFGGYRDVLGTAGMDSSLINETYCGGGEVEAARALNCVADDVINAVIPLLAAQDYPRRVVLRRSRTTGGMDCRGGSGWCTGEHGRHCSEGYRTY